jgi:hypothetical protein
MRKRGIRILILLVLAASIYALAADTAAAQVSLPQSFVLTFANSGELVANAVLTLNFPLNVAPINLEKEVKWDLANRQLVINIDRIQPREELKISVTVDGPPGNYMISGSIDGDWPRLGERFSVPVAPLAIAIPSLPVEGKPLIAEVRKNFVEKLRSDPQVVAVAESVLVPASITVVAVGTAAAAASAVSANAALAYNLAAFFRFLGFGFVRFRRRKPWGTVYNEASGKPIAGAAVKIFEASSGKLRDSAVTDAGGRFGFLLAGGEYFIKVSKSGFKTYESRTLKISEEETINLEIPLAFEDRFVGQPAFRRLISAVNRWLIAASPFILIFGTLVSLATAVIVTTAFNFGIFALYLVIDGLKLIIAAFSLKSFGRVLDKNSRLPVELAVVRIFDSRRNWLLATRTSNRRGQFQFLVSAGEYYLTCAKQGYKGFVSSPTEVTRSGILAWDVILELGE